MGRRLTSKERDDYRMHYYLYDLYIRLAFKNIDRNGSVKKYDQIIILLKHVDSCMDEIKGAAE